MRNEMNSVIKYVISAHTQYIYIYMYIYMCSQVQLYLNPTYIIHLHLWKFLLFL